ncbi:MAG: putative signal transducing protein [Chloroflexota bacterium]
MKKTKDLVKIYTGPEVDAILLKAQLEELGIYTLTKNDFTGAYMGISQPSTDLWIIEEDLLQAKPVIDEFLSDPGNNVDEN